MNEAVRLLSAEVGIRRAAAALGVPRASFYRSLNKKTKGQEVRRTAKRALSVKERAEVREILYSERFRDKAPAEVYAALLDEGRYVCSVRTMYRILDEDKANKERRNQLRHPEHKKPELLATKPNEVWSWDITKLRGPTKWTYYYLYVILDIYSRYTVGWMLATRESSCLAKRLISETIARQRVSRDELTIHSDRGPSMASHNVAQLLASLGVTKSHSRPHVSNDNPFSESQFKTMKYSPSFPDRFGSMEHGLSFCREFFGWYNDEHYHSGIGLLTPASLHYGAAHGILEDRTRVLESAYLKHPERFVKGLPRAGRVPEAVWINPPVKKEQETALLLPDAHCPERPLIAIPQNGIIDMSIEEIKGSQMATTVH